MNVFIGSEWDLLDFDDFTFVGPDDDNLLVERPVERVGDRVGRRGWGLGERACPPRDLERQAADPVRVPDDLEAGAELSRVAFDGYPEKPGRPQAGPYVGRLRSIEGLWSLRQRLSQAIVRSTIQRLGSVTKPFA